MDKQKALEILKEHNLWRRASGKYGEVGATMPHTPKELGEAIEVAIEALKSEIDSYAQGFDDGMAMRKKTGCDIVEKIMLEEANATSD